MLSDTNGILPKSLAWTKPIYQSTYAEQIPLSNNHQNCYLREFVPFQTKCLTLQGAYKKTLHSFIIFVLFNDACSS